MNNDYQRQFMYLFERVGEPLYYGPRGQGSNLTYFNIPLQSCPEYQHAKDITRQGFSNVRMNEIQIQRPSNVPNLSNIGRACPKSDMYSSFNPLHRRAVLELRKILMDQGDLRGLLNMACTCRDSDLINRSVFVTAFASCLLHRRDTSTFRLPALWEIMPDGFFSSFCIKECIRQGRIPQQDRSVIDLSVDFAGQNNSESRLAYFREDMGMNSHHWHWHLIYTLDDPRGRRDRKGELFYWFHHEMISRYDAERLANGLSRVRPLRPDDPVIKEGYFPRLRDSTTGRLWGTRQNDTKLVDMNRSDDNTLFEGGRVLSLEVFRRYRDRVMEAIDKGTYLPSGGGARQPLNIDILGDIIEASSLNPNPPYYGELGLHNVGHLLIAFCHDPDFRHRENSGVMGENMINLRDPVFFRWHKYVDELFDLYKQTLQPYNPTGGELQLVWEGIRVQSIQVQTTSPRAGVAAPGPNVLRTFRMQSHADLSRGTDFLRFGETLGPIFARVTHLNHDEFTYTVNIQNTGQPRSATVRIFMAPRLNEQGRRFPMVQQRLMFFLLDKFTVQLNQGVTPIQRRSTDSSVTVPWDQTFRELERSAELPNAQQSVCGCGWPQHMLLPRGTATGQVYDLVVFLTNGEDDRVVQPTPATPAPNRGPNCREATAYCGLLDQLYPDRKPMGYPFDRNPYTTVNSNNPNGPQVPVPTLEEYISRIPNMSTVQVRVVFDSGRVDMRNDGVTNNRVISGDPSMRQTTTCPSTSATGVSTSRPAASSPSTTNSNRSRPGIPPSVRPSPGPGSGNSGRPSSTGSSSSGSSRSPSPNRGGGGGRSSGGGSPPGRWGWRGWQG